MVQTRRERRAYPSGICEERTTKSEPKRHAALRVAPLLGSGFVAPRSQPHFGGCSLVAPRQNPKSAQPVYRYFGDTTRETLDNPSGFSHNATMLATNRTSEHVPSHLEFSPHQLYRANLCAAFERQAVQESWFRTTPSRCSGRAAASTQQQSTVNQPRNEGSYENQLPRYQFE